MRLRSSNSACMAVTARSDSPMVARSRLARPLASFERRFSVRARSSKAFLYLLTAPAASEAILAERTRMPSWVLAMSASTFSVVVSNTRPRFSAS